MVFEPVAGLPESGLREGEHGLHLQDLERILDFKPTSDQLTIEHIAQFS